MTIKAQLADGRVLEFPDGTNPQVIQATVKRLLGQDVAQPQSAGVDFDVPTAANLALEAQRAELEKQPELTTGEKLLGAGETALTTLTGATGGTLGFGVGSLLGAAGEITGLLEEGEGQKLAEETGSTFTFEPRTRAGQEFTQTIGEFAGAVPAFMGMGIAPFNAAIRRKDFKTAQDFESAKNSIDLAREAINNPKETTTAKVADVLKRGTEKDLADIVQADPNFYRAADELGINTEPLASFASQNSQFRDISGALQSVPGSVLDDQAKQFISAVSNKADDLIEQYGGSLDKALIGDNFKRDALANIDNLFTETDKTYSKLREVLPPQTQINPKNTLDFIALKAMEFGGFDDLPKELQTIFNRVSPRENTPKTIAVIDQVRKEIGQAINRGTGRFKDAETGLNKALYAKLTSDLDEFAESQGGDALAVSDAGKKLTIKRKQLEDNLKTLLGKDLNKALNVAVSGAVKNLSKGQTDQFREVIRAIPKAKRSEVVMTALNDVFKGTGVGQQSLSPTQFTKWYQTINRSPTTRRMLFSVLPKDSQKAIDNLFELSRGISRAQGQKISTGRINALFNEETGFLRRLVGKTVPTAVSFATGSPMAAMATNTTMDFINQSTNGALKASNLVGSEKFQDMIRVAVKDGFVEGKQETERLNKAEQQLMKTKQYREWADMIVDKGLPLGTTGILSYLFNQEEE